MNVSRLFVWLTGGLLVIGVSAGFAIAQQQAGSPDEFEPPRRVRTGNPRTPWQPTPAGPNGHTLPFLAG